MTRRRPQRAPTSRGTSGQSRWSGRRLYVFGSIGATVLILLGLGGFLAIRVIDREKSLPEAVFEKVRGWNKEAHRYTDDLVDLLDAADRGLIDGDEEALRRIGREADSLGRKLSILRVHISRAGVPEDDNILRLKNDTFHSTSYLVEGAENVQVLPMAPPEIRADLIAQARRFIVMSETTKAWVDMVWQDDFSLGDPQFLSREPLIDDVGYLGWSWTPEFADGVPKDLLPWSLNGVPASRVRSEARGDLEKWIEIKRTAAYGSEITASIAAACIELESFARVDTRHVDEGALRAAFEANRKFSNVAAPADAPADSVLSFAAAWRGTRGNLEAYMTGIAADDLGDARLTSRWLFKTYRLTILAGQSWSQGLRIAESKRAPFGYVSSCSGRLEILALSPWDIRQDMTSVIPGPRAYG